MKLRKNKYFKKIIALVIVISCITIALNHPFLPSKSTYKYVLDCFDVVVTSIYIVQALLYSISYGFLFNGSSSYLRRSYWYLFDFIILIISIIRFVV